MIIHPKYFGKSALDWLTKKHDEQVVNRMDLEAGAFSIAGT